MSVRTPLCLAIALIVSALPSAIPAAEVDEPAWAKAHLEGPLSADETRAFMRELAQFVFNNHLKRNPGSKQRGMVYEYFDVRRKGEPDQFVQGEGLDTMHDGAWLAAAMVNAYRATGDDFYKAFLVEWQLPFYLKMLNHSDELFTSKRNDARPGAKPWDKPWAFQQGEKGFVPYFWDDGGSVSIERRRERNPLGIRPCVDFLAGKPNPNYLLDGYSQGMSNHMAQDLGVMLQLAWLLLKDSADPADRTLAGEVAEAARNLHECRVRHFGRIPMCTAPAALANADADLMRYVPSPDDPRYAAPEGAYVRALYDFQPDDRVTLPGFADDQQYRYYYGIAKTGGRVPEPLAFKTIYDAYTAPLLYRCYSDDAPVPAGVNRFDLHPYYCRGGKLEDYRSDRKGPFAGPRPIGSRLGPQNMVCCGWALQMLRAWPGVWEGRYQREFPGDVRVFIDDPPPAGERPPLAPTQIELGDVTLSLVATRSALVLDGELPLDSLVVKLFSRPDGRGAHAVVTLRPDGSASAVNDRGEPVEIEADVRRDGPARRFTLRIPYTVDKEQKPWLNGIEHGRYSISAGEAVRNLYLASGREQVEARLAHELGAGLRTWQAILHEKGYVPTGMNAGFIWDDLSDSGGYAHLISAAAQWLLCLEGRTDWKIHNVPKVSDE